MSDKPKIDDIPLVSCHICLKVVPKSVAESPEGSEYVYYFCGAECYETWQKQPDADRKAKTGKV